MPPITDDHSLFAASSARCTMALACARVATTRVGCGGASGLPRFPRCPVGRQTDRWG